ncbi:DUF1684 domain-containing protein [Mucilaginibacter gynuensis]|uniref:DUF1684 domain-containing protein n=1 Tax=Mucilaginibacter gynuensis TaxID=1302236 RepID=A0ABP8GZD3_9SPHI
MKYLFLLFILVATNSFAQNYNTVLAAHRQSYKDDFLKDANSPLKQTDLKNLHFYDADSTYRVIADVEILLNEATFQIPTFNGSNQQYVRFAKISFTLNGKPQQLTIYRNPRLSKMEEYKDYLFLPFTDETNGNETYGGGRYIDLKVQDINDGHVEIDFNKAYNPYCAYADGYQCPKPPSENSLKLKVEAGEKQYSGEKKH